MKHVKIFEELKESLQDIYEWFNSPEDIYMSELEADKTVHIIVDMINGFVKEGALASKQVLSINNDVAKLAEECRKNNILTIALADSHTKDSPEFDTLPVHCLFGTKESEVTDEIKAAADFILIEKNSINGFLEEKFQRLINDSGKNTFIITGNCTDMCVMQLAMTLKCDFNRRNIKSRVIVPYELSATYDLPHHDAELSELMAFYIMDKNGVEIVRRIKF